MENTLAIFEDYKIRRHWDKRKEKWYFSVVDIIHVLIQQPDYQTSRKYWNKLYELITALPIREDLPLIEGVKNKISFYPSDLAQKIIKGLWLTINDSGSPYNADWSYKREQFLSSNIFLFRSMEAVLRLAYLLNKKYYPHTKWLEKGLANLENDFGLKEFAKDVEEMSLEEKLETQQKIIKKMGQFMIDNSILSKELIDKPWNDVRLLISE